MAEFSKAKGLRLLGTGFESDILPHTKAEKEERIKFLSQKISEYSTELNLLLGSYQIYKRRSKPEYIVSMVEEIFEVENIRARNKKTKRLIRKTTITKARHAARYLMSRFSELTNTDIAISTGGVEHSVISNSIIAAKKLIETDSDYRRKILQCIIRIRSTY